MLVQSFARSDMALTVMQVHIVAHIDGLSKEWRPKQQYLSVVIIFLITQGQRGGHAEPDHTVCFHLGPFTAEVEIQCGHQPAGTVSDSPVIDLIFTPRRIWFLIIKTSEAMG